MPISSVLVPHYVGFFESDAQAEQFIRTQGWQPPGVRSGNRVTNALIAGLWYRHNPTGRSRRWTVRT